MMLEFAYFTLNNVGPRLLNIQGLISASLGLEARCIFISPLSTPHQRWSYGYNCQCASRDVI